MSDDPKRSVFAQIDPATGDIRQWCLCFVAPEASQGLQIVELPRETDEHSILGRRVDLASLKHRDGMPPLATLITKLDS